MGERNDEAALSLFHEPGRPTTGPEPLTDPVYAYVDSLSPASQAAVWKRLRTVARLVAVPDYAALPWGQLRAHHIAFIRSTLVTAEAAPATVNLTLAVLRGIARQARDFNRLVAE